jgi:hypothetical protein
MLVSVREHCRAAGRYHDCGPVRAEHTVGALALMGTNSLPALGETAHQGTGPTSEVSHTERMR